MKPTMREFLDLSEGDKVERLDRVPSNYRRVTKDTGACAFCGRKLGAGYYCFGCKRLVCSRCNDSDAHINSCR